MNIQFYRDQFEHEIDCNEKMFAMLSGVPKSTQSDPRFQRAVSIVDHLVACRENWLDLFLTSGLNQVRWYDEDADLEAVQARYGKMQADWLVFLGELSDDELSLDRKFPEGDGVTNWHFEGQIIQLMGHAHYHRGQVTLLVDQLGGEVVDTDYANFILENSDKYGWKPGA